MFINMEIDYSRYERAKTHYDKAVAMEEDPYGYPLSNEDHQLGLELTAFELKWEVALKVRDQALA